MGPEYLPSFLKSAGPVADGSFEDGGAAAIAASKTLSGTRMTKQQAGNWCWSACTETILDYLHSPAPSQAEIATAHIANNLDDAIICVVDDKRKTNQQCGEGKSCKAHCNDFHRVKVVLHENGALRGILADQRAPTFAEIKDVIDNGDPLVCRVGWHNGGGHFFVVAGWTIGTDGVNRVHILDPLRNEGGTDIPLKMFGYDEFAKQYKLMGQTGSVNFCYEVQ